MLRVAQDAKKTDQILMEAEQIVETFDREGVFYRFSALHLFLMKKRNLYWSNL